MKKEGTYYMLKADWDEYNHFYYKGLLYQKGLNDHSAKKLLGSLRPKTFNIIDLSPEVIALRPFILPAKGFGLDEVLSMIQSVVNGKTNN